MAGPSPAGRRVSLVILQSAALLALFLVVAKAAGAFKEIAVAAAYGTSGTADAYSFLSGLAGWPIALFSMTAGVILVPLLVQLGKTDRAAEALALRAVLSWSGIIGIVAGLAAGLVFWWLGRDGGPELQALAVPMALTIPFGVVSAAMTARLMAAKKHVGTFLEAVTPLVLIASIVSLGGTMEGASLLGLGSLAGFALTSLLLFFALHRTGADLRPGLAGTTVLVQQVGSGMVVVLVAQVAFSIGGTVLDQIVAAQLSDGSNAVVNYTNKALTLVTSMAAIVVGRAVLPNFAEAALEGAVVVARLARLWSLAMLAAGIVLAGGLYVLAPWVISVLYERGEFSSADVAKVAEALRAGVLQLPFYFASLILAQWVASTRQYWLLLVANLAAVGAKALVLVLFLAQYGIAAIFWGTAAMYGVSLLVLGVFILRERDR
ncbi:MAG: hypothetical protein KIT02_08495 [Devosia sp.]|uniref:lipid II flippase MurJ n=1 Tax=Devosia sp. TaxID=1871048 RepID=UPI0024CDA940|nr:lipid II flippase MurJ [Devosia sp.]UYO01223.1 MAG: hypothetical protein KIT02_08495 [Devosia sp.]